MRDSDTTSVHFVQNFNQTIAHALCVGRLQRTMMTPFYLLIRETVHIHTNTHTPASARPQ